MRKLALAIVLLASTSVLAAEQWTEEEIASGVRKVEYVRYAFAGQKMRLQLLAVVELDCCLVEGWGFEIIKQPEHGVAEIVPTSAFPTWPKENPRHKCNEHKVDAQVLTYKEQMLGIRDRIASRTSKLLRPAGLSKRLTTLT